MDLRLFLLVPRGRLSLFPGQSPRLFAAVVQRDVVRGHGISCRRRPGFSLCSVAVFSRIFTSLPVFAAGLAVVARGWVRVRNHTWGLAMEQWNPGGLSGGGQDVQSLAQFRQHPWSQVSIHSHSLVIVFFSHLGLGDMFLHHPLVLRPPQLQHVHPVPPLR